MASRRFKIKYKRLFIFLCIFVVFVIVLIKFFTLKITNIYVSGNNYISDQYIIELAKLENYPNAFFNFSDSIETRIEKDKYIKEVKVKKKDFTKIYIEVVENRPLYFNEDNGKTVLLDGTETSDKFDIPVLVNKIDESIYKEFLEKLSLIDIDVMNLISEISYKPNEVDDELFIFTMRDGNYVQVNIDKFESMNKYFDMVVQFKNHKGILYLDSGEYFKILD